jgi:hypothetical protein
MPVSYLAEVLAPLGCCCATAIEAFGTVICYVNEISSVRANNWDVFFDVPLRQ